MYGFLGIEFIMMAVVELWARSPYPTPELKVEVLMARTLPKFTSQKEKGHGVPLFSNLFSPKTDNREMLKHHF